MSFYDTKEFRKLLSENPDLPVMMMVGNALSAEYYYMSVPAAEITYEIKTMTTYEERWMDETEHREKLEDNLVCDLLYSDMTNEEFEKMIDERVKNTKFCRVTCIYLR